MKVRQTKNSVYVKCRYGGNQKHLMFGLKALISFITVRKTFHFNQVCKQNVRAFYFNLAQDPDGLPDH